MAVSKISELDLATSVADTDDIVLVQSDNITRRATVADIQGAAGGEANTTSDVGAGATLTKAKVGVDLPFKSIIGGTDITAVDNTNDVTLNLDSHTHTLADVTDSGALAPLDTVSTTEIDNDAVTYAKIQNVSATDRFLGRDTAGAGDIEEITATAARTILNVESGATADQSDAEIKTAYENNADTNEFSDAEQTKLTGIEASADVTDATNVAAATAVMDADFGSNGVAVRTAAGAYTNRTITGTASEITVTNGDGVSGNPTISLPDPLNLADGVFQRPEIKDFSITKKTATTHTGSVAIDATEGNVYVDTGVTGNLTLSVTNFPAAYGKIDVWLLSDATGGWTVTFTGFTDTGSAPAVLTASKWSRYILETPDGGTNKFASIIWEGK